MSVIEKKKAAICLSGGIKNGEKCLESIQKLSSYFDTKVFIHTWKIDDVQGFLKDSWSGIEKESNVELKDILCALNVETLKLERFETKRDIFFSLFEKHEFIKTDAKPVGPISMYYSIFQANQILMNHIQLTKENFDVVIRMRFDSDIRNPEVIFEEVSSDKSVTIPVSDPVGLKGNVGTPGVLDQRVYIPEGSDWNGINDQFAYGSVESMNVYSSLFLNLNHLRKTAYYPEALLRNYLTLAKLPVKRTNLVVKINGRQ